MTATQELTLPWAARPDSHCFGCSAENPAGLALRFHADGDGLVADICLDRRYESYPGVLHGGIVALICDEVMGNLIVLRQDTGGRLAVTTSMRMRYVGVISIGAHYRCHASITPGPGDTIQGRAEVRDVCADGVSGDVMATATATFQLVPAPERTQK